MPTRLLEEITEEDIFAAAMALPAAERDTYLRRACNSKPDLTERLTCLIDAFDNAAAFVDEDRIRAWDSVDRIGPYRLLRELGEGGCGIAYLAEQTVPVKREVALKVIKPGMDSKAVIARFEAERQVLALLDHPNVAKVFDAGTTPEGRPYFVMELVRAIRITEYCAHTRLTIPERLTLFIQVCQAIQHAHHKGIIHRDIKPSNVLVTIHNGLPLAKVIDFGIAKATQGRLIDRTLHTEIDQIMGTPAYISPEQAEPAQRSVDTRSDIYSLGAMLYELLTAHTPFDADELAATDLDRMRQRIRTEEPLRPSKRLTSLDAEQLVRIANSCGTTAVKLVKQIRDDLDWIVMQCLEKEPSRRYQTANELISDLDRYLRHELVSARPPSITYTVHKMARRNPVIFASISALLLFLTIFATMMTIQAQRIAAERDQVEEERERAQRVSNVILNVFALADPFQSLAKGLSGPAFLDEVAKSIQSELRDQPAPRARLLHSLGRAYTRRDEFESAIGYLREAATILNGTPGAEKDALAAMIDLSAPLRVTGDFQRAREALVNAEALALRHGLQQSATYAKLLLNRGRIKLQEGLIPAAWADFNKSLQLYQRADGSPPVEIAEVLSETAVTLVWSDDLPGAERTVRQAIEIFDSTVPEMYPDRVTAQLRLAEILYLQNQLDESASLLVDALHKKISVFGPNSTGVIDILDALAVVRYSQQNLAEAEMYSRDAVAKSLIVYGDKHFGTGGTLTTLGRTLSARGKYREAEATLRKALSILAQTLPPDHQYTASTEYLLGELLLATNRPREAEAVLTASMNRWKRGDAPPWRAMRSASALGEALYRQGRIAEAEKYISESFHELSSDPKADREAKDKARARAERYVRTTLASQ